MLNRHVGPRTRPRWGMWLALGLAIVAFAVPTAAIAASPTGAQYDTTNHQVAAAGGGGGAPTGGGPTAEASPNSGSHAVISGLPFTGFDVGVLALASVALLGAGLTLRRLSDPARRSAS
jgi:predicted S18 family serine protease